MVRVSDRRSYLKINWGNPGNLGYLWTDFYIFVIAFVVMQKNGS